jgi:hypothetical protein
MPGTPAPTTRLGDWHAKALHRRGLEVVLASDQSLLPILVPAKPRDLIVTRFIDTLGAVLELLDVPVDRINAEVAEMSEVCVSATRSRQILGSMKDFDRMLDSYRTPGGRSLTSPSSSQRHLVGRSRCKARKTWPPSFSAPGSRRAGGVGTAGPDVGSHQGRPANGVDCAR